MDHGMQLVKIVTMCAFAASRIDTKYNYVFKFPVTKKDTRMRYRTYLKSNLWYYTRIDWFRQQQQSLKCYYKQTNPFPLNVSYAQNTPRCNIYNDLARK